MSDPMPKMYSKGVGGGGRGCLTILETTGNRQMDLGFEIFCVGGGERSLIYRFLPNAEGVKSHAPFDVILSFSKLFGIKISSLSS